MALLGGQNKEDLRVENAELRGENKALHSQIAFLTEHLRKTQDALVAKEAPEAYRDQRDAEAAAVPISPEELEKREKMRKQMELDRKYLEHLEGPLFYDADDMQATLLGVLHKPAESRSIHGDSES